MGSNWKLILVFAVLFLTGAVCGSVITFSMERKPGPPNLTRNFHSWSEELTKKLEKNGKLANDQRAKIRPYIETAVRQMQSIQLQSMIQISEAFDGTIAKIEVELTPEQQKRLEYFRAGHRRWLQKQIAKQQEQQSQ
jgi:hypothetical protein